MNILLFCFGVVVLLLVIDLSLEYRKLKVKYIELQRQYVKIDNVRKEPVDRRVDTSKRSIVSSVDKRGSGSNDDEYVSKFSVVTDEYLKANDYSYSGSTSCDSSSSSSESGSVIL
jgi:hypothetical protein